MDFTFLDYDFDQTTNLASFRYKGKDDQIFTETIEFTSSAIEYDQKVLDDALFFAFIVIGTSYYKAAPTTSVNLDANLTKKQKTFFDQIYQEGLSQFAFENNLTRENLAHFINSEKENPTPKTTNNTDKTLILLSGGKDSLLSAEIIRSEGKPYEIAYISSQQNYPEIIDSFKTPLIIKRHLDKENLEKVSGLNGHVPVTLINEAIAIIEAILTGCSRIELGIGKEGLEPHAFIGDLPVNHQWSKTYDAQTQLKDYLRTYIANNIEIGSVLENYTELEIAKLFAEKCWNKYGQQFSSCNIANYKLDANNRELKWCGHCAKCANSYLLFAPFVEFEKQKALFGRDLFSDPEMARIFKGLLGIDGVMKPFECIASIEELRWAYQDKLPGYGNLPFEIPN
ncbi:hypothetical protein IKE98_02175 [Candidatus Saccharibacteria bacterium]|nr:hypothetical protein [Candidatus Saccharibacteria bacterium]